MATPAFPFPLHGRDLILFSMFEEGARGPQEIPGLNYHAASAWLRRWESNGLLEKSDCRWGRARYRVTSPAFSRACRNLVKEVPMVDDLFTSPGSLAFLASLPHTLKGVERFTAGLSENGLAEKCHKFAAIGWIHRRSVGCWEWHNPPATLSMFLDAYLALHRRPPQDLPGPLALVHCHGIETTWALVLAKRVMKLVHRGPRDLDTPDLLALSAKAWMQVRGPQPDLVLALRRCMTLTQWTNPRIAARMNYYGLSTLLPEILQVTRGGNEGTVMPAVQSRLHGSRHRRQVRLFDPLVLADE